MQFYICGEFGGKKLRSHLHLVFFEFFTYGKIRKDIVKKHNWLYLSQKFEYQFFKSDSSRKNP